MSRCHTHRTIRQVSLTFKCDLCEFENVCSETIFFRHLNGHLKRHETVQCPFSGCEYKTNRLSHFASHSTRKHKTYTTKDLRNSVITETENINTDTTLNFDDNDDHEAGQSSQVVQESIDSVVKVWILKLLNINWLLYF